MKRTRTSSSKLRLARETVRRLVDSHLVHVAGGDLVIQYTVEPSCWTIGCPPPKVEPTTP